MTRKFLIPLFAVLLLAACQDKKKETTKPVAQSLKGEHMDEPADAPDSTGTETPKGGKNKKVTDRDYSITAAEAFNPVFLDSLVMEEYISQQGLSDKKIGNRIRSFYNARNYQYAWFSKEGVTEQTRFFWNQYDYAVTRLNDSTLKNSAFYKDLDKLMSQEEVAFSPADAGLRKIEFELTENFIRYINSTYEDGYVKRKEQEKFIPVRKMDPLVMADSLLNKKHKDNKYYEDVNEMYAGLKKNLALYYDVAKAGGWGAPIVAKAPLKKGTDLPVIAQIKNRLRLSQDLNGPDSSTVFNDTLETAVKQFQVRHGYKPDGIITATLIHDMNVPAMDRLKSILLNMDRMRWMPQKPQGNLIIVNLPEFILHVMDGKQKVFDMVVVVGKVGHNTMMFNGDLNQIVFSPFWNVPPSIIEKEIKPAMKKNPNYLASHNMEQIGNAIRQKPGPGNSLGKVKFIFPNSFNMYFHDTPAKSLFGLDKRAFSHGCIRLSEPQKMAEWLLRNDPDWNTQKIISAMNQTYEKSVRLKQSIPVFIIYYTSWVDENGQLNFRDDVYDHDKELMQKMFLN